MALELQNNKQFLVTDQWLSGFTQTDGNFSISLETRKKGILVRPRPSFNLTQTKEEYELFLAIQKHLGVGKVYKNRNNVVFVIKSLEEIITVLLPLFDKNPLRDGKLFSYLVFKKVTLLMQEKKHLDLKGLLQIIDLSYFMNKGASVRDENSKLLILNRLKSRYGLLPEFDPILIPASEKSNPLTKEFVRGLIDGDGSFNVAFRQNERKLDFNFTVVHELSSIDSLYDLISYFKCGNVYRLPSAAARYQVTSLEELLNNVIPLLTSTCDQISLSCTNKKQKGKDSISAEKENTSANIIKEYSSTDYVPFNTRKQAHFETFIKVCNLIKLEGFKDDNTLKSIVDLAWNMNKENNRKITKEEYLIRQLNLKTP